MSDNSDEQRLIHHTKGSYGDTFSEDLLEQYKLYVQSADNVSVRRVSSGRYLLAVNVALVASYGFQLATVGQQVLLLLPVAMVGILVSLLSHHIIKSHRNLVNVKFRIIHELEQHLPAALYTYERRLASEGRSKRYQPISETEQWIHLVFGALHMAAVLLFFAITFCGFQIK